MAEASNLRIPPPISAPLGDLASSSEDEHAALVDALRSFQGASPEELSSHLKDRLGLAEASAEALVRLVISFESLRESSDWTPEEAGSAISQADGVPAESEDDQARLARRIEQLLGVSSVVLTARITDVQFANDKTWRSARFLTDARTVFDNAALAGSVIITTLEISYVGSDGRSETAYFALDDDDLDNLADAVEAARRRATEVRERLRSAGIRVAPTATARGGVDDQT